MSSGPEVNTSPLPSSGVACFHKSGQAVGLSELARTTMLSSISDGTLRTYEQHWKKFLKWSQEHGNTHEICVPIICDFLVCMYQKGYNCNTLNSIRSALSLFCSKELNLGDNPYVSRLFKSFYRTRPIQPKYFVHWNVNNLLDFLKTWHPISSLSLRHLTLKTLALIALTSSDRGQTLHAMNIENTHLTKDSVSFVIFDRLKTSNRKNKPKVVNCITSEMPALNVCDHVLAYMNRTISMRAAHVKKGFAKPTQLFLSWQTKAPVSKQTISRWLKQILRIAGINTDQFSAHSYRGAGVSTAYKHGATIPQILNAGDWTNVGTFKTYYNNPDISSAVGKIILNQYKEAQVSSKLN